MPFVQSEARRSRSLTGRYPLFSCTLLTCSIAWLGLQVPPGTGLMRPSQLGVRVNVLTPQVGVDEPVSAKVPLGVCEFTELLPEQASVLAVPGWLICQRQQIQVAHDCFHTIASDMLACSHDRASDCPHFFAAQPKPAQVPHGKPGTVELVVWRARLVDHIVQEDGQYYRSRRFWEVHIHLLQHIRNVVLRVVVPMRFGVVLLYEPEHVQAAVQAYFWKLVNPALHKVWCVHCAYLSVEEQPYRSPA